jgi:hypothetical protein
MSLKQRVGDKWLAVCGLRAMQWNYVPSKKLVMFCVHVRQYFNIPTQLNM